VPKLKLIYAAVETDRDDAASLYWFDETGASLELEYLAHGAGSALALGFLDEAYRPDLSRAEAVRLVGACLRLLRERYAASTTAGFVVKLIDRDGCSVVVPWREEREDMSRGAAGTPRGGDDASSGRPAMRAEPPTSMRVISYARDPATAKVLLASPLLGGRAGPPRRRRPSSQPPPSGGSRRSSL